MTITEVQKIIVSVVGGIMAVVVGILGVTNPPVLSTGNALSIALIVAGLGILGVGPINAAYNAAKSADAARP